MPTPAPLSLVAVGDSVLNNLATDCPGCTSALDFYAEAITAATGHPVSVRNYTEHTGLRIEGLLERLETDALRQQALAGADIIVVGISHNSTPWNSEEDTCDVVPANPDDVEAFAWSNVTPECAADHAAAYRPKFDSVFQMVAGMREGKPTLFVSINAYNDWIGWPGVSQTPELMAGTMAGLEAWNAMVCAAAEANGFLCADLNSAFNGADHTGAAGDLLAADYTHPSEKGNEVIAASLSELGFAPWE
jgi:lysophospholipase L1-like esterase